MGAIALLLSRSGPPVPEMIRRMLEAALHRGNSRAVEVLDHVAMGVCNHPEWVTATLVREDDLLAGFCGALDNDADVRAALRREGAPEPLATTPAATLLAAFRRWGEDAVPRLRGSFAGAITDGRRIWCFRDQFGARPLFHRDDPSGFFAATEVKQVLAGAALPGEPDLGYLHGLLFGGVDRGTAYCGVERLPKWTIARAGARPGLTTRQYWDPTVYVETAKLGPEDALEGTREALERAVRRVLTGCDAILLSGGLDAPSLAIFAARAPRLARPVQAVTAIYPAHPSADERHWTRMAADCAGMPLHEYAPEAGSLDDIERWVTVLDGPIDGVAVPQVAASYSEARALGARTVLTGEIAEMLFESRTYLLDHLLSHGRLRAAARLLTAYRQAGRKRRRLARDVVRALAPPRLYAAYRSRRPRRLRGVPSWVDAEKLYASVQGPPLWSLSPRRRWIPMQTAPFRGPGIGFEADEICGAVCGVDSRRPFADVDLWEFVLSLPAEVKFPNMSTNPKLRSKPLLREAMRGLLPDALIDRKDKTFFDEVHLAKADYPTLRRLLIDSPPYMEGIDYRLLRERIETESMPIYELQWARNVARVHAFLNQW